MSWRKNVPTLEERVDALERWRAQVERNGSMGDSMTWHSRADRAGVAAPSMSSFEPWTSVATQFRNSLTSFDFAKSTLVDIGVCTAGGGVIGTALVACGFVQWEAAPASFCIAFVLAGVGFTLHKRSLLGKSVNVPDKQRKQADRVLYYVEGHMADARAPEKLLHVAASIDDKRLAEWARGVLAGQGLGWRDWTGKGRLFTDGEYASIRSELIKLGFARDVGGSTGLVLTVVGRSLLCSLVAQ